MSHFAPIVVAAGLCAIFVPLCAGEEPVPLRVSVVSSAAKGCPGLAMQEDVEGRLRAAGFTLSSVHNAEMGLELDCIALAPNSRNSAMAVHECLNFSQLMPSPANRSRAILASTWRQCQSYTSSKAQYQAAVRLRTGSLFKLFQADFQDHIAPPPAPVQAGSPPAASYIAAKAPDPAPQRKSKEQAIFYSAYAMVCLSVFLFWQLRRRRFALPPEQDHAA